MKILKEICKIESKNLNININNKESGKIDKEIIKKKKIEKNTSRPHYIFYFEPHKKISDSNFKNISSMTYHSGQS